MTNQKEIRQIDHSKTNIVFTNFAVHTGKQGERQVWAEIIKADGKNKRGIPFLISPKQE